MEGEGLTKKERREIKRQEKEVLRSDEIKKAKFGKYGKLILILIVFALVLFGIYLFFFKTATPTDEDYSQEYSIVGRDHVPRGTSVTSYNSNPPTSGNHWFDVNAPVSRGVHDEEMPDEALVHNLEHGEIWISYKPGIPEDIKNELRDLAKNTYKVVLTIRSKDDADIAVAAWGRLDKFNLDGKPLDIQRIRDFINRYRNKGPELIP